MPTRIEILDASHPEIEREQTLALTARTLEAAAVFVDDEVTRATFLLARDAAYFELTGEPLWRRA